MTSAISRSPRLLLICSGSVVAGVGVEKNPEQRIATEVDHGSPRAECRGLGRCTERTPPVCPHDAIGTEPGSSHDLERKHHAPRGWDSEPAPQRVDRRTGELGHVVPNEAGHVHRRRERRSRSAERTHQVDRIEHVHVSDRGEAAHRRAGGDAGEPVTSGPAHLQGGGRGEADDPTAADAEELRGDVGPRPGPDRHVEMRRGIENRLQRREVDRRPPTPNADSIWTGQRSPMPASPTSLASYCAALGHGASPTPPQRCPALHPLP